MKRSGCKTVLGLLVVQAIFVLAFTASAEEAEKKFSKEFSAQGKDLLKVDNRYGDVVIENWNESRVLIDVVVTVKHPSKEKADKYLSMIDIYLNENDNTIEATTKIEKNFSFKGGSERDFSIDYVVKMPTGLNLKLINRYGQVEIAKLSGHVDIAVKYGSIYVAELSRGKEEPLNSISLAYSKGEIVDCGWCELNLAYVGRLNVSTAKALLVDSKHSKLFVDELSSMVANSRYDHIEIEMLKNLVAEGGYTGFKIGAVSGKVDISSGYGSISVDELKDGFEMVDIEAKYCQVKIDVEDNASYKLKMSTTYSGLHFDEDNAEIINRIYDGNRKSLEAVIGNKETESNIKVKSTYGSVKVY